jgi:hypothetical protein
MYEKLAGAERWRLIRSCRRRSEERTRVRPLKLVGTSEKGARRDEMAVRPQYVSTDSLKLHGEMFEKHFGRIYILWLAGIAVGAIKLNAVSIGGMSYKVENPDLIQGLLFAWCLSYYFAIIFRVFVMQVEGVWPRRALARRMLSAVIYVKSLRGTLKDKTRAQVWAIKETARLLYKIVGTIFFAVLALPIAQIVIFERHPWGLRLRVYSLAKNEHCLTVAPARLPRPIRIHHPKHILPLRFTVVTASADKSFAQQTCCHVRSEM